MKSLTGFGHRQIMKRLKRSGFEFYRQAAGRHAIWYNPSTDQYTTIPDHPGDMPEGTLHAILKEAGITLEEFLNR